ncbi:uncharacterized protein LOC9659114 [Selaginella moellendorffii]|uniref:uncharacterized protein LOC9659114 n=1 Tax=Selaginella moellendorffii TaxID=88036 RepID=UPI000D1CFC13|nr:uncharacterized protein LOC9659114 [Selaginella moellendorffii]|eukprot:XP_002990872.2 uncharacterized protein LOC9659114 [Selaginella moellendorffii]
MSSGSLGLLLHCGGSFAFAPDSRFFSASLTRSKRGGVLRALRLHQQIAQVAEQAIADASSSLDGPIELPGDLEQPTSPLQIAGSVVLTGAISVLLLRSLRRRYKEAKEKKPLKEQAKQNALASLANQVVEKPPPSFEQTLYGALLAGAIAFVLYQCTTAVTGSFASKPLPTEYATRNIAVTVRTIISGICYLATFVFAADAIGLALYGLQLLVNPPPAAPEKGTDEEDESAPSEDKR